MSALRPLMFSLLLAAPACAPDTIIRRTALINAPQSPTREGLALDKGQVRLSAHLSGINDADDGAFFAYREGVAEAGDAGVLIPDFHLGASVWVGLPAGLELGAQLYYAAMDWADPNVGGVLPFPREERRDLFMGGVGMRLNVNTGVPELALAMMFDLNLATIPEAVFLCHGHSPEVCRGERLVGEEVYRFERVESALFVLPNVAIQLGWRPGSKVDAAPEEFAWMPYLLLGLQSSVTNTGFEKDRATLPDDSLTALWMGYVGLGVDATWQALAFGASVLLPIEGERSIDFGPTFDLKLGARFL